LKAQQFGKPKTVGQTWARDKELNEIEGLKDFEKSEWDLMNIGTLKFDWVDVFPFKHSPTFSSKGEMIETGAIWGEVR